MSLLKSPVGTLYFMAAENPVKATNGKMEYTVTLIFDEKKDAAFLSQIREINDAKVVTESTYRGKSDKVKAALKGGKAKITATSQFKPEVFDAEGNRLEEAPYFFADSTGTAQMVVQPWNGERGSTINLIGIQVHTLDNPEGVTADRETRMAQLKELIAKG